MKKNIENPNLPLVVSIYGGPGTGKSTFRARLFTELKYKGIQCNEAPEYAQDKVVEESFRTLDNQIYIFGKQHHRIYRQMQKFDVVITDSPLLNTVMYDSAGNKELQALAISEHNKMNSLDILLVREHEYQQIGRYQSKEEAEKLDRVIENILKDNNVVYTKISSSPQNAEKLAEDIVKQINGDTPGS